MSFLAIVPILAFLIVIHELGHFFAARSVGVTVEEFGIGLPPRAKAWRWKDVKWSLNWIPFGGFVRVKGEDAKDMEPGSMNVAGPWQRAWFLIAGPLMNLLAAVVLSIVLVAAQGVPTRTNNLYIDSVATGSPAEAAGWQPGDQIIAVDGDSLTEPEKIVSAISDHAGENVKVTVQRGSEPIETTITPRENPPAGQGATGISYRSDGRLSNIAVRDVEAGSPAAEAGIQDGDRITEINGIELAAWAQALALINEAQGEEVTLTLERDGEPYTATLAIPPSSILIRNIENDSIARDARLFEGDKITALNGEPVTTSSDFLEALAAASGEEVQVTYTRDTGTEIIERTTSFTMPELSESASPLSAIGVEAVTESGFIAAGVVPVGSIHFEEVPASQWIQTGWSEFWTIITGTIDALRNMFTQGVELENLAGPIGMGQYTGVILDAAPGSEWAVLTQLTVVVSISLGLFNLLPIPALDGGRLLFVAIEILRGGKRVSPEKEGIVHLVGMMLLLVLMFLIAFNDVARILDGRPIIP